MSVFAWLYCPVKLCLFSGDPRAFLGVLGQPLEVTAAFFFLTVCLPSLNHGPTSHLVVPAPPSDRLGHQHVVPLDGIGKDPVSGEIVVSGYQACRLLMRPAPRP